MSNLYKCCHKKDSGSCTYSDAYGAYCESKVFDSNAILLNDESCGGVYEYIFCTEEAAESIKDKIQITLVQQ